MAGFEELVFSGVQPTGNLHLGNYLGAISRFVTMQENYSCIYCVVDLHAITVPQDPRLLKDQIREVTAAFIAAGIDPKKNIVFNQSQVPQHAELAWVFNCVARMGLAQPHDAVQGEGRQGSRERLGGAVRLSDPDGRRYPRLPRHPCPRGR